MQVIRSFKGTCRSIEYNYLLVKETTGDYTLYADSDDRCDKMEWDKSVSLDLLLEMVKEIKER